MSEVSIHQWLVQDDNMARTLDFMVSEIETNRTVANLAGVLNSMERGEELIALCCALALRDKDREGQAVAEA